MRSVECELEVKFGMYFIVEIHKLVNEASVSEHDILPKPKTEEERE